MSGPEMESAPRRETGSAQEINDRDPCKVPEVIPGEASAGDQNCLLSGRTDDAVTFLEGWCPGGPWVLTSIIPDGKTETDTFWADDMARMRAWIDERQGVQNIYFTVNRTFRAMKVKPKKLHIRAAHALHVDVDPRVGEDPAAEKERAIKLLRDFKPAPTVIIDSGGGAQGFWLLDGADLPGEPEDETRHHAVEDRNLKIEADLQADACHNIDRIMRLPGTVNVPGAKKRAKGRVPALARVVEVDWTRRYRLDAFTAAPRGVAPAPAPAAGGPVGRVNLDDLAGVPDRTRALIVQGTDPDDPAKWSDRSALVLHVLCDLIRADVSDDDMLAVILDQDFGVSAHVREQPKPESYARRQVQRALERQPRPGPIVVSAPLHLARAFRAARRPHLLHHQQEFLDWDGAAYVSADNETVRAEAWGFLETCRVETTDKDGTKKVKPFVPIPDAVSATVDALKAVAHLPPLRVEPPRWLDGRAGPDPLDLLPTRSGLLHLPSGDLLPATPELFTRNALDFAHDPAAPAPVRWLAFLSEVWPGDDEADCIAALQEFMGYLLTPDTSLQKALLIPGPKRSGKGTIGRIMGKLVGEANTVAPSLNSLGRSDFGLEPLLAKQLAIVSDMRLSSRTDEAAVAENLLRITGEDRVSVNRKHRSAVEVTLRARFVVMTNEVPKFADRSGALVSRFIVLPMRQSFFGREDSGLTPALMAELPGILNWAMEGWRRVRARGRITQPEAGRDVALQMTDLASPIPAFVREWCEVGGGHRVAKDHLFSAFRAWHRDRIGHDYVGGAPAWANMLYSAMEGAVRGVKAGGDGGRVPSFGGIRLRPDVGFRPTDAEPPF